MTALFLDLDGPILDVRARYYQAHRSSVERAWREGLSLGRYWQLKRRRASIETILLQCGEGGSRCEEYSQRFVDTIESPRLLELDRLQVGAREWLEEKARRHSLVLVTLRQVSEHVEAQLSRFRVRGYFKEIWCGSPLASEGFMVKAALMVGSGEMSAGAVVLGDTEVDVRAGKQLGLATVALTCGIRNRTLLLAERPDLIRGQLRSISCADLEALA